MSDQDTSRAAKIVELERQLEKAPTLRGRVELARLYHEEGQLQKAADACALAVAENPAYVSARVLLGRVHFDMGSESEAREHMERVLALAPDNLVARRVLARICEEQGDRQGAVERYRALLAFAPDDKEIAAKIRDLEADPEPAGREPSEGPVEAEGAVLATPTLAEIYVQQGLTSKAIQVYEEILAGDPKNDEARARLEELRQPVPQPEDPEKQRSQRKIEALRSWLEVIRGGDRRQDARGMDHELE